MNRIKAFLFFMALALVNAGTFILALPSLHSIKFLVVLSMSVSMVLIGVGFGAYIFKTNS